METEILIDTSCFNQATASSIQRVCEKERQRERGERERERERQRERDRESETETVKE